MLYSAHAFNSVVYAGMTGGAPKHDASAGLIFVLDNMYLYDLRICCVLGEEYELPRWRSGRDLQTFQYCLWRRRNYINSGRLMANKKCWEGALKEAGALTADEMWQATAVLGKNAGFKEALAIHLLASRFNFGWV
jgi:hypothetical protein